MHYINYISRIFFTILILNLVILTQGKNIGEKCEKGTTRCNIGWESLLANYTDGDNKYICLINNLKSAERETFRNEKFISHNVGHMTATLQCDNFNKTLDIVANIKNAVFLRGPATIKDYKIEVIPFNEMGIPDIKLDKESNFYLETFYTKDDVGMAHLAWELEIKVIQ
ncbi:hypothetical protein PIROE2DRAFT_62955 [Piromyces sp. E2]|nr:hypothetical protein PIROE2DRAFT_62955 [Piromyces sp. E2]|eukprot:OUM60741.1 hypothetical protein PIROE2DRAFT_62955 [Piromyces sp. E2]